MQDINEMMSFCLVYDIFVHLLQKFCFRLYDIEWFLGNDDLKIIFRDILINNCKFKKYLRGRDFS